ncbi:18.1 kDa class I heat shock protein-like [Trifolium pratense]|nr:18.1 kDa class I heat shock protein-like [Trifolium pratense]
MTEVEPVSTKHLTQSLQLLLQGKKKMSLIPSNLEESLSDSIQELSRENPIMHDQIDWKETPEAHVLKADVPGLKKEEVKVEVEDGRVLQITGERSVERDDVNDAGGHRVERSSGKFMRSFTLPANCKMDEVKASIQDGVLTVTVPKQGQRLASQNSN